MPQDSGLNIETIERSNGSRRSHKLDFSKPLIWDSLDAMDQWKELVVNPPLHSVVVWIDPVVCKAILKASNDKNRPISNGSLDNLVDQHETGNFSLTGDTIKFSRKGRLLDGQYRLTSGVKAGKGFETHMVFGLDEEVFDILDRQRTRTAGDILAMVGIKDAITVAGAVRWVLMMEKGARGRTNRGMSPRRIREMVTGPMKGIANYTRQAEAIRGAYKVPPTIVAALLFMISRHNKAVVDSFVEDWLHGNRNYTRNKAFDMLAQRIQTIRAQNKGALNRTVLSAMLVMTFNYWNANVAPANARAFVWTKDFQFPQLAFDKEAFQASLEKRKAADTSLPELQERILKAFAPLQDKDGNVDATVLQWARATKMDSRHINYVLGTLADDGFVHCVRKGRNASPGRESQTSIWRLKEAGEARLKAAA